MQSSTVKNVSSSEMDPFAQMFPGANEEDEVKLYSLLSRSFKSLAQSDAFRIKAHVVTKQFKTILEVDISKSTFYPDSREITLCFVPKTSFSVLFHGAKGLHSKIEVHLICRQFDGRSKILLDESNIFRAAKNSGFHFEDMNGQLKLKASVLSIRQLGELEKIFQVGPGGFAALNSRNIIHSVLHGRHSAARKFVNDVKVKDETLQESVQSACNLAISEIKELFMTIPLDTLEAKVNGEYETPRESSSEEEVFESESEESSESTEVAAPDAPEAPEEEERDTEVPSNAIVTVEIKE